MKQTVRFVEVMSVEPIEGADAIELAFVEGWQCVIKKGEFKPGDIGVYFEVDSFIPVREEFEFLRASSYRNNQLLGEGFRVKTMKMRGRYSQGLLVPPEVLGLEYDESLDLEEILNVKRWEVPAFASDLGTIIGGLPDNVSTTKEYRLQTYPELINEMQGLPYYITTKYEGTSATLSVNNGEIKYMGHHAEYQEGTSAYQRFFESTGILDKVKKYHQDTGQNIAVQMEMCGPSIQGNVIKLQEQSFYIFDVIDLDTRDKFNYDELVQFVIDIGCDINSHTNTLAEVVDEGDSFNYTFDDLLELSDSNKYFTGTLAEGIVVRPKEPQASKATDDKLSIKVISRKYQMKDKN